MTQYAYLHGFASSPGARKAVDLARRFRARGGALALPDLNRPSFSRLTISGALEAVAELAAGLAGGGERLSLIGSSMGGLVAARFAELHPEKVERLVLLCPGFDMPERWRTLVGEARLSAWEREGELVMPDAEGREVPVHWGLVQDARRHPAFPRPSCPVLIVHGRSDRTVPIEVSRAYASSMPGAELVEVDDDHRLLASVDLIFERAWGFFGLSGGGGGVAGAGAVG